MLITSYLIAIIVHCLFTFSHFDFFREAAKEKVAEDKKGYFYITNTTSYYRYLYCSN